MEQIARNTCNCADLMDGTTEPLEVFSYHYYNGVSERLASVMPNGHWQAEDATSEEYLGTAIDFARTYALPNLNGEAQAAGTVELAPGTCTFLVM